ncbi:MAG: GTPase ObgE [Candidatus Paceibacterota bacterium]|jgi:GTP-binding protein
MAFTDEIKIYAKAGDGGNGVVRWRHEKGKPLMGPGGGNAGRGGNVYVEAIRDVYILAKYKNQKEFIAERGEDGGSNNIHGANGEDCIIELPIGSIVTNLKTDKVISLVKEGQRELLLEGGNGGLGNEHFKSSTNTTPKECTFGKPGDDAEFFIELQLFADIGLIGLPNAGKSSLLNSLTNAKAKIGSYQFTTLDPNLGSFYGFVIADIPGLIEGASEGKGLGTKFLKHIKRTKMLIHLISFEKEDMVAIYKQIRKELEKYGEDLVEKEEIILLTKTDLVDEKTIKANIKKFSALGGSASGGEKSKKKVFTITLYDDNSIKQFSDSLVKILEEK